VELDDLLSFLVLMFLVIERVTVLVVIAWATRAARLGVGAISQGLSVAIISGAFVLVVFAIVCGIRSCVVIVSAICSVLLVRRTTVIPLCLFSVIILFCPLRIFHFFH
jgi:hypothetical protein